MPYIRPDDRPRADEIAELLVEYVKSFPVEKQDGVLNYAITKTLKGVYEPGYFNYNRAMGLINSVGAEWYRRDVAQYEDKKIKENGDVV